MEGKRKRVRERVRESGMNRVLERVSPLMSEIEGVSLRKGVSVGGRDQEKFRGGVRKCDLRGRDQWDSGRERVLERFRD